jgi:enoyl-CoA hydratase
MSNPTNLKVSAPEKGVLTITLHRPEALNALNTKLLEELVEQLQLAETDDAVGAVVITGSAKAFAAGADVREMASLDAVGILKDPRVGYWKHVTSFKKPIIAAVNGFCFGGGCELAMHADIIIAGEDAKFGQPEIKLGIMPGAGGTQRLLRSVGKSMAMQMVLTGEPISAKQAIDAGLISEITVPEMTLERAQKVASQITRHSPIAVEMAKDALLKAFDTDLSSGLLYERKAFTLLAATEDRNEGINAFLEKRKPLFKGC